MEIEANDGSVTVLQNKLKVPRAFKLSVSRINLSLNVKQLKQPPAKRPANTQPVYITTTDDADHTMLTCDTNPFKAERVAQILQEVTIGPDITDMQHDEVHKLLGNYADCFVLAIKEVNAKPGAIHKLNTPEGATFQTKIPP